MTAGEFWKQQEFSYLETYSFNRGPKLLALHEATCAEIERVKQQLQSAPFRDQRKLAYQLRMLEGTIENSIIQKPLTSRQLAFDVTAEKIALIKRDSAIVQQLGEVLQKPATTVVHFMCLPIYRDALVFYNGQGQLVRVLNICFECLAMLTENGTMIEADVTAYEALSELLCELGHPLAR